MTIKRKTLHWLLILCLLSFGTAAQAASSYYIHALNGHVERLVDKEWHIPTPHEAVSIQDKFLLREGAMLAIADKANGRVYVTRQAGVQNVAQIISAARKQSGDSAGRVFSQLVESAKDGGKHATILGGVNRGHQDKDVNASIYSILYKYLQKTKTTKPGKVCMSRVMEGDYFHFRIHNPTQDYLFAQVLALHSNGESPTLCFDSETSTPIVAIPDAETDIDTYLFAPSDEPCRYLLIASPFPFDAQALMVLLSQKSTPDKKAKKFPLQLYLLP